MTAQPESTGKPTLHGQASGVLPTAPPFVGRQREIDILGTASDAAIAGRPRVILLAGEPGIGKSYTAQEAARRAAQRGMLVVWGRCSEEPGAPPYWPWLQLIRRYIAQHDDTRLRDLLGPAAPHVVALDAELAARLGIAAASPEESDAAKARFRLFDSIAGFWRRATNRRGRRQPPDAARHLPGCRGQTPAPPVRHPGGIAQACVGTAPAARWLQPC